MKTKLKGEKKSFRSKENTELRRKQKSSVGDVMKWEMREMEVRKGNNRK